MQHLDGHVPLVPEIVRQVHGGHAAHADLPLDAVPIRKRTREGCVSHSL